MLNKNNFLIQFIRLAGPYWFSENKTIIWQDTLAFIGLTILQIVMAVVITQWNADLFDALESHSMSGVGKQVSILIIIFIASIVITTFHLLVKRRLMIGWRLWLTELVTSKWMYKGRHYQVTFMGKFNYDNPDGRIAEDIRIATEDALALAHSLFYSLLLLFSFTEILWFISGQIQVNLGLFSFSVSGYLVWIALIYSLISSIFGWITGKPLTSSTNQRQTEEANYRHDLIVAQENSQAIALLKGEKLEHEKLMQSFQGIIKTYELQTLAWKQIQIFQSGYSVVSMALPVLVAAPRYISNAITLGTLMQSVQAFQQLTGALAWPVHNMPQIASWRTSVERVLGLVKDLDDLNYDIACGLENQVCVTQIDQSLIKLQNVRIVKTYGNGKSDFINLEIKPGERLRIGGANHSGAKLFQAIAGLWPWGEGHIFVPQNELVFFMPPQPYFPEGTLYEAICYPQPTSLFDKELIITELNRVGLNELVDQLDQTSDWKQHLSHEHQQLLGAVRALLQRPQWLFIQEALDALSTKRESEVLALLDKALDKSAIICMTNQTLPKSLKYNLLEL